MKDRNYYRKIYQKFICSRKNRTVEGVLETHHIRPRCIGGRDLKINLIKLTPREHFFAHLILTKIYPNNWKIKKALSAMICGSKSEAEKRKITSKKYDQIKKLIVKPAPNKKILEEIYFSKNLSFKKIGEKFRVSDMTVCKWFKLYNIKAKNSKDYKLKIPDYKSICKAMQKHKKVKYAAKEFKVSRSAFYGWLKHYNFKLVRKIGIPKPRPSLSELMHLKYKDKKTLREISRIFNVTPQTIRRWLRDKSYMN